MAAAARFIIGSILRRMVGYVIFFFFGWEEQAAALMLGQSIYTTTASDVVASAMRLNGFVSPPRVPDFLSVPYQHKL